MSKMPTIAHTFTEQIEDILKRLYGAHAREVFEGSSLLGYLNLKTRAANRGSKARGAFANHYALYVVIEDYINKGFFDKSAKLEYSKYTSHLPWGGGRGLARENVELFLPPASLIG